MNAPAKDLGAPSPEDLRAIRRRFAPLAGEVRRRGRMALGYLVACVLVVMLTLQFASDSPLALIGLALAALALWIQAVRAGLPLPPCPACGDGLDDTRGDFCPACASPALGALAWNRARRCGACSARLSRGMGGRYFRIRACNHCGVMLDERGL